MKNSILILSAFAVLACNDKKEKTSTETKQETQHKAEKTELKTETPIAKPQEKSTPLFGDAEVEALPLNEATDFDTFINKAHSISAEKVKEMGLTQIAPEGAKFYYQYRIESPAGYDMAIITAESGEEMFTNLVTFDKNHKVISDCPVAYDEIAESWLRKTSKIEKGKVTVTTMDYSNTEEGEKHIQVFKILDNGKIKEQK